MPQEKALRSDVHCIWRVETCLACWVDQGMGDLFGHKPKICCMDKTQPCWIWLFAHLVSCSKLEELSVLVEEEPAYHWALLWGY